MTQRLRKDDLDVFRRRGGARLNGDNLDGDVVVPALFVRAVDEDARGVLGRVREDRPRDLFVGDEAVEAVGAEDVDVASFERQRSLSVLDVDLALSAHRAADDVALRMVRRGARG